MSDLHDRDWAAGVRLTIVQVLSGEGSVDVTMGPLARAVPRADGVLHVEDPDGYALLVPPGEWSSARVLAGTDEYADEREA